METLTETQADIETIQVGSVTYYLPASTDDVLHLVNRAHQERAIISLRGAAHSFPLINDLETEADRRPRIYLMLAKMDAVRFDDDRRQVTVQGGCHLGFDPRDPTGRSTTENSLCYQLDQHGWAIPDLGGITHQTVGGFLSTGSSGGSTQFSFDDQLVSLTLVTGGPDGARLQTFSHDDPRYHGDRYSDDDNPFFAAGVALGLFGVIVSATFQCVPKFNIRGAETTTTVADCPIDLFGDQPDKTPFDQFLHQTPYTRLMWWPQPGVESMVVWQAAGIGNEPDFKPIPYQEVPWIKLLGHDTPIPAELGADAVLSGLGWLPTFVHELLGNAKWVDKLIEQGGGWLVPKLLRPFVTPGEHQSFQDVWYNGIPMDNQMSDTLMPVWFTELWIPIEQAMAVMRTLRTYFDQVGLAGIGTFSYEIYATKSSRFWLSPSYGQDVVRVDVFWFANNPGSPADTFYPQFWNLLAPFGFRPHWGKYLPAGDGPQGVAYLHQQYVRLAQWLALRAQMDPQQVFVSAYWRGHLGIPMPA